MRLCLTLAAALVVAISPGSGQTPVKKINVAHRGASAYAPEHTLAAYRLALEQGADFVEQDLAVTKDGILICLHDPSLERTTNVEEVYPDRFSDIEFEGKKRKAWLANDFTLEEIKKLDAGAWFDRKFAGERVPTFDEAVALVKDKAGMFPELKTPEIYAGRDVRFEEMVAAALDRHGLRGDRADARIRIILQTFGEASARKLAEMRIGVPVVLLIGRGDGWTEKRVGEWRGIVQGLGPDKGILLQNPSFAQWTNSAGLMLIPYTFRSAGTGSFPTVAAEMEHFLYKIGVDGLFTDNPDLFPRR